MSDFLLRAVLSNLCLAIPLALLAFWVQSSGKRPVVAHLLWVIVLAKLVTPPLTTVPLIEWAPLAKEAQPALAIDGIEAAARDGAESEAAGPVVTSRDDAPAASETSPVIARLRGLALWAWAIGTLVVASISVRRILRFHRLLDRSSSAAPPDLERRADALSRRFGLGRAPDVFVTEAEIMPLVWGVGLRPRLVVPRVILRDLSPAAIEWVLAHEIAHLRRRDHLVRWLEWAVCIAFWWNPLVWWARRNLRVNEEICCDALVLATLQPNPHDYADSLLAVVEHLSTPHAPPGLASAIDSGGLLERRFEMILSKRSLLAPSTWLRLGVVLLAVGVLPVGIAYADAPDFEAVSERLMRAVHDGELTPQQAESMMADLARNWFAERLHHSLRARDGHDDHGHPADSPRDLTVPARRLGYGPGVVERVGRVLRDAGMNDGQVEQSTSAILRVVAHLRSKPDDHGFGPRLAEHLRESANLSDAQIRKVFELVHGLSRRAQSPESDARPRDRRARGVRPDNPRGRDRRPDRAPREERRDLTEESLRTDHLKRRHEEALRFYREAIRPPARDLYLPNEPQPSEGTDRAIDRSIHERYLELFLEGRHPNRSFDVERAESPPEPTPDSSPKPDAKRMDI